MSRQSKTKPSNKSDKDQKKANQKKSKDLKYRQIKENTMQSENKYNEFIENLNDVFYTVSIEGIITYASKSISAILGYIPSELIGTNIIQLIHPDHKEQVNKAFKDILQGKLYPSEYRLLAKNGREKWVRTSSRSISDGKKIIGLQGILTDITDRKIMEDALKKSEFRLNRAELISRLGNWEIDLKTGIITGSTGALKIYGIEENNWKLSETQKIPLEEYREYLDKALKNLIEKNIPYNVDFKIKKYDTGEIRDIHSIAEYDRENKIVYGILQDITDRKQAEEALRKSEAKYRALNELISDYTFEFTVNPDSSILLAGTSENFERITGRSKENVSTIDSWKNIFHPQDLPKVMTDLGLLVRNGRPFDLECRTSVHQGTRRWIHIVAKISHYDVNGRPTTIIGSVKDITERKKAEESLKASEERFRKLLQSVTDYIYTVNIVNGNAVSTHHGPACVSVTGYTSEEFSNDTFLWYNIIHKDDRKLAIEITDKIIKGESIQAYEHRIVHKTGTIRWVRNTPVIRRIDKGEVIEYDGLITDITEKKIVEEKILKLNLELEARVQERTIELALANKELEAFSYSVSHDLKSPLRAISGFSSLALEKIDKIDGELLDFLKKIYSASDKMSQLIDDLLNLSRITQQEINKSTFDISELVKIIFDELCGQYSNFKIEFNYQKKLVIIADLDLVKIMLKNLLNNALKYSSKKLKIKIEFGSIKEKEKLTFYIKDNGDGFDMKYAGKIFAPFQRLHSEKEFEGTGIGLAIVQRIIKKHGGNVWIDSKKGTGTSVFFNL